MKVLNIKIRNLDLVLTQMALLDDSFKKNIYLVAPGLSCAMQDLSLQPANP